MIVVLLMYFSFHAFLWDAAVALAFGPSEPPESIFVPLSPSEGLRAGEKSGRVVIVVVQDGRLFSFGSPIWKDQMLVERFRSDFLAVEVEDFQVRERVRDHRIAVTPTAVAFRDGEEIGRLAGPQDAAHMGKWLDLLGEATPEHPVNSTSPDPRATRTVFEPWDEVERSLAMDGPVSGAEEFGRLWNWDVWSEEDPRVFRLEYLLELQRLVLMCPECATPIEDACNTLEHATYPGADFDPLTVDTYWMLACGPLSATSDVIDWVRLAAALGTFDLVPASTAESIAQNLCWNRAYRLAALVEPDAMRHAEAEFDEWCTQHDGDLRAEESLDQWHDRYHTESVVSKLSHLHLTALAGGRVDDAREIVCLAIAAEDSDSTRIRVVADALHARIVHPMHLELIEACDPARQFQREYVEEALREWPRVWETPLDAALARPAAE